MNNETLERTDEVIEISDELFEKALLVMMEVHAVTLDLLR